MQNLAQLVTASYQVAAAVGRLTARDLHLPVPLYDETAYYNAVKDKWVGLGDYATGPAGPLSMRVAARRGETVDERIADAARITCRFDPGAGRGGGADDPSMEDILASIRRILSEDEATAVRQPPAPRPQATPSDRACRR